MTRAGAERARKEPGSVRTQRHEQGAGAPGPGAAPQPALSAAPPQRGSHCASTAPSAPTVTPRAPRPHLTPPRAAIGPFRRPSADPLRPLAACRLWAGTPAASLSVTRRRAPSFVERRLLHRPPAPSTGEESCRSGRRPASRCHWPSNLFSGFRFSSLANWIGWAAAIGRKAGPGGGTWLRSRVHWPPARCEWQEGEGGGAARGEGCVR